MTWLAHPDGSWARASSNGTGPTIVHQSGPRRLWEDLDGTRGYWLTHGELPVRGARALITPDGRTRLARAGWRATLGTRVPRTALGRTGRLLSVRPPGG